LSSTSGTSFVRAGRAADAPELARIQVASWREDLSGIIPPDVLTELTAPEAEAVWTERWREAITSPPTSRHRVFVAVAEGGAAGFASAGPATDPDLWPATDGQLYELRVLPERADEGHASRLLHAVADTLADDGFRTMSTWAVEADKGYQEFLVEAGWAPDGAKGELELGNHVAVLRLRTAIGGYGGEPE
jgi:GNAT superfamily N-acetyltransferase